MQLQEPDLNPLFSQSVVVNTFNTLSGENQWDYMTTVKNVDGHISVQSSSDYIRNCVEMDTSTGMPTLFLNTYVSSECPTRYDPTGKFKIPKVPSKSPRQGDTKPRMKQTTLTIDATSKYMVTTHGNTTNVKHSNMSCKEFIDTQPSLRAKSRIYTVKNIGRSGRKLRRKSQYRYHESTEQQVKRRTGRKCNKPSRANVHLHRRILHKNFTTKLNRSNCKAQWIGSKIGHHRPSVINNQKAEDTDKGRSRRKAAKPNKVIEDLGSSLKATDKDKNMQQHEQQENAVVKTKKPTRYLVKLETNTQATVPQHYPGHVIGDSSPQEDAMFPFIEIHPTPTSANIEIPHNLIYSDIKGSLTYDRERGPRRRKNYTPGQLLTCNKPHEKAILLGDNMARRQRHQKANNRRIVTGVMQFLTLAPENTLGANRRKNQQPRKLIVCKKSHATCCRPDANIVDGGGRRGVLSTKAALKTSYKASCKRRGKVAVTQDFLAATKEISEVGRKSGTQEIVEKDDAQLFSEMIGPIKPVIPYSSGLELDTQSTCYSDTVLETVVTKSGSTVEGRRIEKIGGIHSSKSDNNGNITYELFPSDSQDDVGTKSITDTDDTSSEQSNDQTGVAAALITSLSTGSTVSDY